MSMSNVTLGNGGSWLTLYKPSLLCYLVKDSRCFLGDFSLLSHNNSSSYRNPLRRRWWLKWIIIFSSSWNSPIIHAQLFMAVKMKSGFFSESFDMIELLTEPNGSAWRCERIELWESISSRLDKSMLFISHVLMTIQTSVRLGTGITVSGRRITVWNRQ